METIDLSVLTLAELDTLARRVEAERRRRIARARAEAVRQIRELARAHGIDVAVAKEEASHE